jgi:ABC-2 type transport system ATP-binding protein
MSQRFSLYDDLTVEENIDFYSGIYQIPAPRKIARKEWVLDMAGLEAHRRSRTSVLSGGWKQRLALGCAILHEPPILFLDEPTSGVDPGSRRRFWDLIYELSAKNVTVFVTTHYMDEAEYCDRIALIYRGELIANGSPASLKTEQMPEQVLEIVCERPADALSAVARVPGVRDVALFGKGLHAVTTEAAEAARDVRVELGREGYRVERIARIEPSLEDVFVSLIETHNRAEQPLGEVEQ